MSHRDPILAAAWTHDGLCAEYPDAEKNDS
jgi:hypothetical protein